MVKSTTFNRFCFILVATVVLYKVFDTLEVDPQELINGMSQYNLVKLTRETVINYAVSQKHNSFILMGRKSFDCINLPQNFTICLYTSAFDSHVSDTIRTTHSWEPDTTNMISNTLKAYPNAQFIDIGAFVGWHTLNVAAKLNRSVVTVDPFIDNIYLIGSSLVRNKMDSVTLYPYCVYKENSKFNATVHVFNPGGTPILKREERKQYESSKIYSNDSVELNCVTLDSLANYIPFKQAILKIDIEGSEIDVFKANTSSLLFDKIDIPVVFMEWGFIKSISVEAEKSTQGFFTKRQYVAHVAKDSNLVKLPSDTKDWPQDIVWKRVV